MRIGTSYMLKPKLPTKLTWTAATDIEAVKLVICTCWLALKAQWQIFCFSSSWQHWGKSLVHCISTWLRLFHDLSINQFENCFRLDCSRLIIQMHIHSDYLHACGLWVMHHLIFPAERERETHACTAFVCLCALACFPVRICGVWCMFALPAFMAVCALTGTVCCSHALLYFFFFSFFF